MLSMSPQLCDIFTVYTDVSILVVWRKNLASMKEKAITNRQHNFRDNEINLERRSILLFIFKHHYFINNINDKVQI